MKLINEAIQGLQLGEPQTYQGLTIFPLLATNILEPDYLTLDEALEQDQARVTEVSMRGSIPTLSFENHSDRNVLIVDGDELVGAKQNRSVNLSILVPRQSRLKIPVSCTERGRWSYKSRHFKSNRRSLYSRVRAAKTAHVTRHLRTADGRIVDQYQVWEDIAACSSDLGVDSTTGSMGDIYEHNAELITKYRRAFNAEKNQVAAVFSVNGRVAGAEYFDSPKTFGRYLDRLVGSYAVSAILKSCERSPIPQRQTINAFLAQIATAHCEYYAAVGLGEDVRLSGRTVCGGALIAKNRLIHMAVFRIDEKDQQDSPAKQTNRSVLQFPNRLAA